MKPLSVQHINFERSVAFYESVLGCKVFKREAELGLIHLRAGSSMIDCVSVAGKLGQASDQAPAREGTNVHYLCLRVEPFADLALRASQMHRLAKPGKMLLEIIEVQSGSYLGKDDIVRFEDTYRRS